MASVYEFRHVRGHIEVYKEGQFYGSADTMAEAVHDILEDERANPSS